MSSKLDVFEGQGEAIVVRMNSCKILGYGQKKCIGTRDLNGCTGVVIQSPTAIILAHIAPRPGTAAPNDTTAGDRHMATMMDEVIRIYEKNKHQFSSNTAGSGVYAFFLGKVGLPDQKKVVEQKLASVGLTSATHYYNVPTSTNPNPGRGTILVGWVSGPQKCDLYVEDIVRNSIPVAQQFIDRLASSSTTTLSARTTAASSSTTQSVAIQGTGFKHSWTYRDGEYVLEKIQSGETRSLQRQKLPPMNQPILVDGVWRLWDGSRWTEPEAQTSTPSTSTAAPTQPSQRHDASGSGDKGKSRERSDDESDDDENDEDEDNKMAQQRRATQAISALIQRGYTREQAIYYLRQRATAARRS